MGFISKKFSDDADHKREHRTIKTRMIEQGNNKKIKMLD